MSYTAAENRYDTDATGMQYRFTGRSGLQLPVLSLGLWQNFGTDRPRRPSARSCAGRSTAA